MVDGRHPPRLPEVGGVISMEEAMQAHPNAPKTDDFRLERDGDALIVTFTPDGRSYTFAIDGDRLSDPEASPAQTRATDYAEDDVRRTAAELARLALTGSPSGKRDP
ncbi:hypothetical protein FHR70_004748 [Microvirga lupini]|uniref:Uncharacterized protein n=1 Tax=Microvirga lupini TaxID=420324 RepID=A0A7W4VRE7_9HYPH|nr:hypothetical protein [Microvirga lupini]MBB3021646.1 hypothetical protein [Microvirga lupini]